MERPRLLFICLAFTSFVKDDLALLRERYDVRVFHFDANRFSSRTGRLFGIVYYGVKQFLWLLRELPRADLVFGWFAGYHLVLPVLLARGMGKPAAVALGGTDSNWLPELEYGVYDSPWQAPLARWVLRRASLLLPVAEALIYSESRYATWPERRANGVQVHVPELKTPCEVVPFGFDPGAWPMGALDREPVVSTVALIASERTLRVKGVDVLFEVARELPDVTFQVVGIAEAYAPEVRARFDPPPNVRLLPPRPRSELPSSYANASVYVQLSRTEGMPNVLCEAMLCGCIPVGSDAAGIPHIIGEAGFVVDEPDASVIAGAIQEALGQGPEARRRARRRIKENFPVARRRKQLISRLEELREGVERGSQVSD